MFTFVHIYLYIVYTNIHYSSSIHKSQKIETTQIVISGEVDKQKVVYPYNGMLFSYKKERSTDTWYNLDEPCKHYAK